MNGKKVLITGANGLVGNYMVQKCIDRGAFVTAVDIREPKIWNFWSVSIY